jgi:serine/threonine-protein kinase mTOR
MTQIPIDGMGDPGMRQELGNDRALVVYNRVQSKLTGKTSPDIELTSA